MKLLTPGVAFCLIGGVITGVIMRNYELSLLWFIPALAMLVYFAHMIDHRKD